MRKNIVILKFQDLITGEEYSQNQKILNSGQAEITGFMKENFIIKEVENG